MEDAAVTSSATRNGGVSLPPMPSSSSQPSRKEWRVVSEQTLRTSGTEDLERTKLGQSDERLIYEHGRDSVDVDFCSITIDGDSDNNILQQRLHAVAKQREELQQMEIELRAQAMIVGMHNIYEAQIKEHANANIKLQEQLHEKEHMIFELERRMSEKERELHAIKLDNEAAWAKEDLLREQSKELQSYMRDRDNSEAERAQHIKQIHELQEHTQEKERQLIELQEQHRIVQETVLFKDKQIREAQTWITCAQEMDAFKSTTSHTLQAELRERTEQFNQLWVGCQGQFAEMERLHLHIQQLKLELADLREKSGIHSDGSQATQMNQNDASQLEQVNGSPLEVNGNSSPIANPGCLHNGNSGSATSFPLEGNTSAQIDHVQGVAFAPTSLLGMPTYLPNGQVTALHPFVVHQQGMPHPSHVAQSPFHSVPMSALQSWQNQITLPDGQPILDQYPRQTEQNLPRSESHYDYEASPNDQVVHANYLDANISGRLDADSVIPSLNAEVDSTDKSYDNAQSQQSLHQISSQFHDALRLDGHGNDTEEKNGDPASDQGQNTMTENSDISVNSSSSDAQANAVNETTMHTVLSAVHSDAFSTGHNSNIVGKSGDSYLLDERALLASIARTIGSGSKIRISSTLHNRLGKMLAPLHWHDYKKKYGKLDDFVASHPELFFIEGDYIQLREGAQESIAAKAAVAKVAAAAAAPSSYSSLLPSVSVTPMARSHRSRKSPSVESSSMNADKASFNEFAVPRPSIIVNHPSQFASKQDQNLSISSLHVVGGVSNVKILTKPKDQGELNSLETRPTRSEVHPVGNGLNSDRTDISQNIGAFHGRPGVKFVGKQQSRTIGPVSNPRR